LIHPDWLRYIALSSDAKPMAENLYRALWSWLICVGVTVVVSLCTEAKPAAALKNLVWAYTDISNDHDQPLYKRPLIWGIGVGVIFAVLQYIFW